MAEIKKLGVRSFKYIQMMNEPIGFSSGSLLPAWESYSA